MVEETKEKKAEVVEQKESKASVEKDEQKQCEELYDKKLEKAINVEEEDDSTLKTILQRLANEEQAVYMALLLHRIANEYLLSKQGVLVLDYGKSSVLKKPF